MSPYARQAVGRPRWPGRTHAGRAARLSAVAAVWLAGSTGCGARATHAGPAPAPVTVVRISNFAFVPARVVVVMRDSIVWVNDDAFNHSIAADNGVWSSPELGKGGRYALRAPAPGVYPYHCAAHPGMKGVLEVRIEE